MLKISILVVAVIIGLLCLLQEDKNDGVMSLSGQSEIDLFRKNKKTDTEKPLKIATAVLTVVLFALMTANLIIK